MKVGLKPTYNLLLLRDLVYRMICFRKHFHILLELPFELLPTLSTCYVHVRLDASTIFTIIVIYTIKVLNVYRVNHIGASEGTRTLILSLEG